MTVEALPDGAVRLPNGKIMSAEDIRKQRETKERKKAEAAAKRAELGEEAKAADDPRGKTVKRREWLDLGVRLSDRAVRFRLATWNMLAQTLVRRELFPGSDCLKFKDRKDMLAAEVKSYPTDVLCLQECDQMEFFRSILPAPAYQHVTARGPKKLHGLVIVYRTEAFRLVSSKTIYLDEEELVPSTPEETERPDLSPEELAARESQREIQARGGTRQTKNICLMVLLESRLQPGKGILVATTHLFWHPHYSYERTRQVLILLRAAKDFRDQHDLSWPLILAGDLNTYPTEPIYHLLIQPNVPLDLHRQEIINASRVVHQSLTKVEDLINPPEIPATTGEPSAGPPPLVLNGKDDEKEDEEGAEGEGEGGEADPEKRKNARQPEEADGLLTPEELQRLSHQIFGPGEGAGAKSAYGSSGWQELGQARSLAFAASHPDEVSGPGDNEPNWTSYTPLWHLTLDYILDVRTQDTQAKALRPLQVLAPHRTEDLGNGLPKKGICASDHVLLGVEYELS